MRLREALDLRRRHRRAEHAPQVLDDHAPPERQQVEEQLPGERHRRLAAAAPARPPDALRAIVRQRHGDAGDARAVQRSLRALALATTRGAP